MTQPALELRGINKFYGPVHANQDVDLVVAAKTVHALVGENGAGKSTLMKIAYGHAGADSGQIFIQGEEIRRHSVAQSIARKVGMVHQHFMLVGPLSVIDNVILGNEPRRRGLLDMQRAEREITAISQRYGLEVDPHRAIEDLSVGQQQRVEIIKMLWRQCNVLILDEPTAVLTPGEVRSLFEVLRSLVAGGMTIILITHKLDEVLAIADRVTVMRKGRVVSEMTRDDQAAAQGSPHRDPPAGLSAESIARAMVGSPVLLRVDKEPARVDAASEPVLAISDLHVMGSRGIEAVRGLSLEVRAGEILGIAGVEGNGQTELIDALVGLRPVTGGAIHLAGKDVTASSVRQHYDTGLAHIPEDRHDRALVLDYSVQQNLILGLQRSYTGHFDLLERERIATRARDLIAEFDIRPDDPTHLAGGMSGGNQQKIVVARELSRPAPRLLLCAQPTRGVDIGAIEAIHRRMIAARDQGLAVLLVSAELTELTSLSDRLAVMYKGRIVATFSGEELSGEGILDTIGALMTGARTGGPGDESDENATGGPGDKNDTGAASATGAAGAASDEETSAS